MFAAIGGGHFWHILCVTRWQDPQSEMCDLTNWDTADPELGHNWVKNVQVTLHWAMLNVNTFWKGKFLRHGKRANHQLTCSHAKSKEWLAPFSVLLSCVTLLFFTAVNDKEKHNFPLMYSTPFQKLHCSSSFYPLISVSSLGGGVLLAFLGVKSQHAYDPFYCLGLAQGWQWTLSTSCSCWEVILIPLL